VGPTLLANLGVEDGNGFQNFSRMGALGFELLRLLLGSACSESVTVK
jgi:hypothetical protein